MQGVGFCPAHITGFFKADIDGFNPATPQVLGSTGAGFSIQQGVTTTVEIKESEKEGFSVQIAGYMPENTQVSEYVIQEFFNVTGKKFFVKVKHKNSIPVGYGLGCSGAVALSLAIAMDKALETHLSPFQIGQIAHKAEVECRTGLGDVLASFHGGFEIRTKPGAPGIGGVEKIETDSEVIIICFAPISTKKFISEKIETINGLGGKMVAKLRKSKSCDEFQDMSVEFAKYIQVMTPKRQKGIDDLHSNGIKCGVALFGETIYSIIPNDKMDKVTSILGKYDDGLLITSKIDNIGARAQ